MNKACITTCFVVLGYQTTPSRTSCVPCAKGFYCPDPRLVVIYFSVYHQISFSSFSKCSNCSVGQSVGGWSVNWSGNHLVVWERQSDIYSFTESSICQSLLMPCVWKFLVIHQCHVLLACTLWEVDLKTVQHVQLEVHALILLVHLWLVLEVNIPFYWLLKLQT